MLNKLRKFKIKYLLILIILAVLIFLFSVFIYKQHLNLNLTKENQLVQKAEIKKIFSVHGKIISIKEDVIFISQNNVLIKAKTNSETKVLNAQVPSFFLGQVSSSQNKIEPGDEVIASSREDISGKTEFLAKSVLIIKKANQ